MKNLILYVLLISALSSCIQPAPVKKTLQLSEASPESVGMIEIESGMPFDVFLRTRLFEPLGMNDTWFYLPEDKAPRLVSVQKPENGKWVRYPVTFYDPDWSGRKRLRS